MTNKVVASTFIKDHFLDPKYQEVCYFISDLLGIIKPTAYSWVSFDNDTTSFVVMDYSTGIEFFVEDQEIIGLEFYKLKFQTYDYFMRNPAHRFYQCTRGELLTKSKDCLMQHITKHNNIHMSTLRDDLP